MSGQSQAPTFAVGRKQDKEQMEFSEIGARLGISRQLAYRHFVKGMAKLRRDRRVWKMFVDANLGIRERESREQGE